MIVPLFQSEYEMHQQHTIDEATIPFRGRWDSKSTWRISPRSGHRSICFSWCYQWLRQHPNVYVENSRREIGLCTKDLTSSLENSGLHLYMDYYHTSPDLYPAEQRGWTGVRSPKWITKAIKDNWGHLTINLIKRSIFIGHASRRASSWYVCKET